MAGLKRAYAAKAAEENEDCNDSDEEDSSDYENEVLDSDEDELNDDEGYLRGLQDRITNANTPFAISSSIQVTIGHKLLVDCRVVVCKKKLN